MVMIASRKNPYIIGRPVSESDRFFDRENLFGFLTDTLPQAQVILLHGQRRIGKSSVLTQIPHQLAEEPYQFVVLSLEGKSQDPLAKVLHDLAIDIQADLNFPVNVPSVATLSANPDEFADHFLVEVQNHIQALHAEHRLVLLFDEFDTLGNYHPDAAATHLFPYLNRVIERHRFLHVIPVIGRRLKDLPTLLGLFRNAPTFEIGLINQRDTYELIMQPSREVIFYEDSALEAIWQLTAGHPYFTQVICFAIFSQAREDDWWQITDIDVERAVERAIELGEGGLAWFWDGLPIAERVFFSATAEVAEMRLKEGQTVEVKEGDPLALLEDSGVMLTDCLHNAQRNLLEWRYLTQIKRVTAAETVARSTYQITIELVRRWLIRRHGIKQEIWELQELEPDVKPDYENGRELRQQRSFYQAILAYEKVLLSNPNHISALFELAECLLATQAYSRAIELFERAYQVDLLRALDGLVRAHLGYAKILIDRDQLVEAEQSLDTVENLNSQPEVTAKLRQTIQAKRATPKRHEKSWGRFITDLRWNLLGGNPKSTENPDQESRDSDHPS
ncbi:AAA family ATPase [filamentous cyanobacterium LEGE 11480]|uniref:AAA family ATPase n=1 Tax=Romeriopsis navalis LEGE 11480 TaxID=2777977 RepID=A0A928Z3H6_9CYAN|nr:tetratricopeptide repeat protein [Romeriopsis navalis]MBE9031531.1 AAA family ATPase [Romeriopsis navalis LEGE 11480]